MTQFVPDICWATDNVIFKHPYIYLGKRDEFGEIKETSVFFTKLEAEKFLDFLKKSLSGIEAMKDHSVPFGRQETFSEDNSYEYFDTPDFESSNLWARFAFGIYGHFRLFLRGKFRWDRWTPENGMSFKTWLIMLWFTNYEFSFSTYTKYDIFRQRHNLYSG